MIRLIGCALAATAVLVHSAGTSPRAQVPVAVTASRLLVVPFEEVKPDPRSYWLREGSAVILTDSLLAFGLPAMGRSERLRSFELLGVPVGQALSHATVLRIGQVIGASHIITGAVTVSADQITVRARATLLDAAQLGPEISESGPLADIFAVYDRLAMRLVPGSATPERLESRHPPVAAFESFIKGLIAEAPTTKLSFLGEALRQSPTLHRARLAAWDVHNEIGEHERALAVARQVPQRHPLARQARFLATLSLMELMRDQEAFEELTRLNNEDVDATLLNNLGIIQLRRPVGSPGYRATTYFNDAASLDGVDSLFNLGYAYWLDGDASAAVLWLREAVRRNPADHAAHYVLGVALAAIGNSTEGARERALAKQLSSSYADWEATSPSGVPRGLERVRSELDVPDLLRIDNVIVSAGQRDQLQLAAFHLDAARRAFDAERDSEAIASLRRVVYLSPYDHEAHLLLGRTFLRGGRLAEARDSFKISIWSRDTVEARLRLADVYEKMAMTMEASAELRAALQLDPSNVEAKQRLSRESGR